MKILCVLTVVTLIACGSAAQERKEHHYRQVQAYVFQRPLAEVWPVAAKILTANVMTVHEASDHRLESNWVSGAGRDFHERIVLVGETIDEQSCRVQFLTERAHADSPIAEPSISGDVQTDLELRLIQEFDPVTVQQLKL